MSNKICLIEKYLMKGSFKYQFIWKFFCLGRFVISYDICCVLWHFIGFNMKECVEIKLYFFTGGTKYFDEAGLRQLDKFLQGKSKI